MKRLVIITGVVSLMTVAALAAERSMLARVTVYWASGGSGSDHWTRNHKAATNVRLREGHCAVDPRRIPYGSKIVFPDGTLTAVDTGGQVKSRRAARRMARSAAQRNAIVIDRFFETKQKALAWAKKNPHFMTVRVVSTSRVKDLSTGAETRTTTTTTATKLAANKPTERTSVATTKVASPSVAPSATPGITAVAKTNLPAQPTPGLRTSVPTARTPAPSLAARPQSVVPNAQPASSATNPTVPNAATAVAPRTAAPTPTGLAANTAPQLQPPANLAPAIMVHGPSHHDRRVAYMP